MEELIKITEKDGNNVASARELHKFLEINERFSRWFERMTTYSLVDGVDYALYQDVNPQNKQEINDFALTIDCAKVISMLQRNEKGNQARRYFIECEKKLKLSTQKQLPQKDLVETQVSGSDNVVVERWGTKPWQMEMRGILVDMENKIYPQSQIESLTQFFEINDIIDVEGIQFEDKRIESLYFKSIRITPVEGFQDTIQFSLTASQIQPVSFNVLNR